MQETVGIVIIAESVVRTSIVYNFIKLVCSDIVMFERSELESDRTWHAVGGIHTINGDPNVVKLKEIQRRIIKRNTRVRGPKYRFAYDGCH